MGLKKLPAEPAEGRSTQLWALAGSVLARWEFVVYAGEVRLQHAMDAPIAKAPACLGNLHDLAGEVLGHLVYFGWVAVTVALAHWPGIAAQVIYLSGFAKRSIAR